MKGQVWAIALVTAFLAAASFGWAQGTPGAQPAVPPVIALPPPAPEAYTYNPEGRRDPFVSLLARGAEVSASVKSGGLAGIATADLMVRGVMQSRGAYVAIVRGPDGRTYRAHANDRLLDGIIRSVTPQGLVIMQDVNDPLSLVKQREVRKGLRTAEDGQ